MRLVIGITGASGVQYGIRLAEVLQGRAETHLVITKTARQIIEIESDTGTIVISAPKGCVLKRRDRCTDRSHEV